RLQRLPPAGLLPCLRGREDGHLHLLGPDAVLLFADDPLDLLCDAEAEGQPGVKTGGERPRDRGAQHEAMPGGLSFRGRFAQGAALVAGLTRNAMTSRWSCHRCASAWIMARPAVRISPASHPRMSARPASSRRWNLSRRT